MFSPSALRHPQVLPPHGCKSSCIPPFPDPVFAAMQLVFTAPAPSYDLSQFEPIECKAGTLVLLHGANVHYSAGGKKPTPCGISSSTRLLEFSWHFLHCEHMEERSTELCRGKEHRTACLHCTLVHNVCKLTCMGLLGNPHVSTCRQNLHMLHPSEMHSSFTHPQMHSSTHAHTGKKTMQHGNTFAHMHEKRTACTNHMTHVHALIPTFGCTLTDLSPTSHAHMRTRNPRRAQRTPPLCRATATPSILWRARCLGRPTIGRTGHQTCLGRPSTSDVMDHVRVLWLFVVLCACCRGLLSWHLPCAPIIALWDYHRSPSACFLNGGHFSSRVCICFQTVPACLVYYIEHYPCLPLF